MISRPGQRKAFVYSEDRDSQHPSLLISMASCRHFEMLRRIRHLKVCLCGCPFGAQEVVAALCLMLSGTACLKKVTVDVSQSSTGVDIEELVGIIWPFTYLGAEVEIGLALQLKDRHESLNEMFQAELEETGKFLKAHSNPGLDLPGNIIAKARARAAALIEQHDQDWGFLRNISLMLLEVVRCMDNIKTFRKYCGFMDALGNLASYANEDDRGLESLEKMSQDAQWVPQSFPSRYAGYRRRGTLTDLRP